jgi:hypothetical protein
MCPIIFASVGCGAGVPVQLVLDEFAIDLSIDDALESVGPRLLPPDSPALPERWPDEFPDVCWDTVLTTDPDLGGRIDLTPDPMADPAAAEKFGPINDGLVDRIEIDRLVVRIETNTLNVPLPVIEVQAADAIDAAGDDRRAWRTIGAVGGTAIPPPCAQRQAGAEPSDLAAPGALGDFDFVWARGGESYLNAQLADDRCLENQGEIASADRCKELSLRARSRLAFDTARFPDRPRGDVRLRLILVATFFVKPI